MTPLLHTKINKYWNYFFVTFNNTKLVEYLLFMLEGVLGAPARTLPAGNRIKMSSNFELTKCSTHLIRKRFYSLELEPQGIITTSIKLFQLLSNAVQFTQNMCWHRSTYETHNPTKRQFFYEVSSVMAIQRCAFTLILIRLKSQKYLDVSFRFSGSRRACLN